MNKMIEVACASRPRHCVECLTQEDQRKRIGFPKPCPHGVTVDNLPKAPRQSKALPCKECTPYG